MAARQKFTEVKHFEHFISHLSVVPLYEKPESDKVIISQLLFGETGTITSKKNKHWCKIHSDHQLPDAWVCTDQITLISEKNYNIYKENTAYLAEINHIVLHDQNPISIVMGSCLRKYDGISFHMPEGKYICNGTVAVPKEMPDTQEVLIKIARRYLFAPYLKGGRTPYGIDPFGLVQLILRNFGIIIPSQPEEMMKLGEVVDFVDFARAGDIAFFDDDDEGKVHHCAIITGYRECLHTDAWTKTDKLDHYGIYCSQRRKYTHKLRLIKRMHAFR